MCLQIIDAIWYVNLTIENDHVYFVFLCAEQKLINFR